MMNEHKLKKQDWKKVQEQIEVRKESWKDVKICKAFYDCGWRVYKGSSKLPMEDKMIKKMIKQEKWTIDTFGMVHWLLFRMRIIKRL